MFSCCDFIAPCVSSPRTVKPVIISLPAVKHKPYSNVSYQSKLYKYIFKNNMQILKKETHTEAPTDAIE